MSDAMAGHGDDDRHSAHQLHDAESRRGLVEDAAERIVPDPTRGAVVLADDGCAQGGVSNLLVREAIERIRVSAPDVPIIVVHNDVLPNDWATLFANLGGDDGYVTVPGGPITPMASATSFYDPVVPRGQVDLGFTFASVQWLAEPGPGGSGAALYFDQLDGAAGREMADQAHADWCRFLERGVDELAPGGRLIIAMMGVAEDRVAAGRDAWAHVSSIAAELVDEGRLDANRLVRYVFPVYERTLAEAERPFRDEFAGRLVLEYSSIVPSLSPAKERYFETGDAAAFADEFLGFFRAFSEPSLRVALDPSGDALDELYRRFGRRLAGSADDFDFTVHVITLVVSKPVDEPPASIPAPIG